MTYDQSKLKIETAREIVRLSELYLDGTVRLALNADTRATTLAGMLATLVVGTVAAGVALLFTGADISPVRFISGVALLTAAVISVTALWYAVRAAKPRPFNVAGNSLKLYSSDADLYGDLKITLMGQAEIYQEQIDENKLWLSQAANDLRISLSWISYVLPLSALVAAIASALKYH
jgi:hypothetical protein